MDFLEIQTLSNVSPVTAIATVLVLSLAILYYFLRDSGLPPGPWGLPYLGYYPFLKDDTVHLQLQDLMKKYGEVYSLTISGQLYIHLGTIKALKEAHLTKSDCFTKRYSDFNVSNILLGEGVACANGESWKAQRKFFTQTFRNLGITSVKDYMTGPIYDSLASTVKSLKAEGGKPVNVIAILNHQCFSVLRRMMFNDDEITEEELKEIMEPFEKVATLFAGTKILLQGEVARRVIFPLISDYKISLENRKIMAATLRRVIKRHDETFNKDNIRDLIDCYIKERNERRSKDDPSSEYFTENGLISSLIQFVGDSIFSIASITAYFIFELLEHPEEQEKIFKEMEEVIGHDRQPTLDDKSKLPYTNACMHEAIRLSSVFTIFPSLECTKETTLNGYKIPKGAVTLLNFWSSHRDPKTFEDPDEFKPSRYVTEPGKEKSELPILFGVGKRSCIGESFAMMQMFLSLATLVKNFRLTSSGEFSNKSLHEGKFEIIAHTRE